MVQKQAGGTQAVISNKPNKFFGQEKIPGTFSPKWRVRPRVCSLCEVISRATAREGHLDFFVQKSPATPRTLTVSD